MVFANPLFLDEHKLYPPTHYENLCASIKKSDQLYNDHCEHGNSWEKITFAGPYKYCQIHTNENALFEELVFPCLAWNQTSSNLEQYFVSRKYDATGRELESAAEGRFVFAYDNNLE